MKIEFAASRPSADVLVLPVEKDGLARIEYGAIDGIGQRLIAGAGQGARFDGEAGSLVEATISAGDDVTRIALLGVGNGSEVDYERAGGALTARYLSSGVTKIAVDFGALGGLPTARAVARFAGAAVQRSWRFDKYRTKLKDKQKSTLTAATLVGVPDGTDAAWATQDAIVQGLDLTRTLVSEPANIIYPESFVDYVVQSVAGLDLELTVLGEDEMTQIGMGALLGVSQGSAREAKVLALRWNGAGGDDTPLAFVGKGVTFDSGGISIKAGAGMEDMKWDMGGAGAVVGAMKAIAGRKARANVVGVCGLVENMPDGAALRPSDVLTSMNGQTIEVLNTDAEGRLVLADAITWTQSVFKPKVIVDLATLTGAMIVALGFEHAGLFANDDALADQLLAAGKASGDKLWRLPIGDAYDRLIDSPIADMKNVGPRGAGSITAAQFIGRFVDEGVKWAHLDVAGMVWSDKPGATYDKGATGYGVRLLDRFVADNFEN